MVFKGTDSKHRVVSSNLARVTMKTPLARNATGNHQKIRIPKQRLRAQFLVYAELQIEYVMLIFFNSKSHIRGR